MRRIVLVSLLLILCLAIAGAKTCTSDNTKMSNAMLNTKTHLDESKDQNLGVDVLESKNTINFEAKKTNVKTWHVDDDKREYPNAEYANIQDAINAASDGDVILVYTGTYTPFDINKSVEIRGVSTVINNVIYPPTITNATTKKEVFVNSKCLIRGLGFRNVTLVVNSEKSTIFGNEIVGSDIGILIKNDYVNVSNNIFLNTKYMIRGHSNHSTIKSNYIKGSLKAGILLRGSSHNLIGNNIFEENKGWVIEIDYGEQNRIINNIFINTSITKYNDRYGGFNIYLYKSPQTIIEENLINAIPLHTKFGFVGIFAKESNKTLMEHNVISSCMYSVVLQDCSQIKLINNTYVDNVGGIILINTHNSLARNNKFISMYSGIDANYGQKNTIEKNVFVNMNKSIILNNTKSNGIYENIIDRAFLGISLSNSDNNEINSNSIFNCTEGVNIKYSSRAIIDKNFFKNNDWATSIKSSNVSIANNVYVLNINTINVYSSNSAKIERNIINANSYGIVLENSNSCNIENNRISNITHYALKLIKSNENFVRNNTIVDNEQGIFISGDKNTLTRNVVGLKNGIGNYILFITSKSNLIYLNDFSSSRVSTMGGNRFYSPDKIKYEYEGKTFTNYLGNYWGVKESLLTLLDHNKDGIIDMEKKVGMDIDKYQLAKSFKKYRILG